MANDEILDAAMRQIGAEEAFQSPGSVEDATARAKLDDLVLATKKDAGAAFRPAMLTLLAALKKADRQAFEALRARLKTAGCRVTELDSAMAGQAGGRGDGRPTQTDILIELAPSELFHTPDGSAYADFDVNGHRETWPIRSMGFRRSLTRRFYEETKGAPNSEAMQAALSVLEAKAHYDGPERIVHVRVGGHDGRLYLDLCDDTWRVVEIDASGWRVISDPPVRFRRTSGMKPLPVPIAGGSIEDLRPFVNVRSDADFVLALAWTLACLRNRGPYPLLALTGEQGSAKSTLAAILRALVDPNAAPLRSLPRENREMFIAANNAHILAFDNLSGLSPWISDTLCQLSTGGGFAVRQLYSDQDETLFDASRPVILTGIEDIVTRPDLADRAVFLTLEPIPEEQRRPESELWAAFDDARPGILGALMDAVARGLAMLPQTKLDRLPRMADFALWAAACETALWPAGTFEAAYAGNRASAVEGVIDGDPIAATVRAIMAECAEWSGTYADLLNALDRVAGERAAKSKIWPTSTQALSGRLRRAATFLRKLGIEFTFGREGHGGTRTIHITSTSPVSSKPDDGDNRLSALSASSARGLRPFTSMGAAADTADTSKPWSSGPEKTGPSGDIGWSARI